MRGSGIAWIADAFHKTSQENRYQGRWLTDQKWSELVHSHYFGRGTSTQHVLEIKESAEKMKFNRSNLIRSIGKKWVETLDDFTETNRTGIFRHIVQSAVCPNTGTRRRVTFFHVTKPGKVIKKPPEGHIFNEDVQDHGTIGIRKQKQNIEATTNPDEPTTNSGNSIESQQGRLQRLLLLESTWHLPEYKKLFWAKNGESVDQCLDCKIALMCERHQIQAIGNKGQTLLFAEVKEINLADDCAEVNEKGRLKVFADNVQPLARLGAGEYGSFGDILNAARPS